MNELQILAHSIPTNSIIDYFSLYKKINQIAKQEVFKNERKIKIAVLSSFTIKGIEECLYVECCKLGILPDFFIGGYNQYYQEILDEKSNLYSFNPDLIITFLDIKSLIGELYYFPYQISDDERRSLVSEKIIEIKSLIFKIREKSSASILFHNFEVPSYSPYGILDNKQDFGFIEAIETLNTDLRNAFKNVSDVFIFDFNSFCSNIGKKRILDYKMCYLGDMKIDLQHIPELCKEYTSYIKPLFSLSRKCLVLDLDNTLWGGIIGEDGLEGIKLGPTPEGRPFLEFQKHILALFNRGIILAINSKNNFDDVLRVFKEHPYMILKEEHFAAMQINWDDKVSNMRAIAEELNIGMDSLIFLDDDNLNREMIRSALPDVLVIDLPEDPALYPMTLMQINDLNVLRITEEDMKKGQMYAEQRKRTEYQKSVTDITEYLKGLEMVVTVEAANSFNIPRISQLTQKTNQFNMTTRRYLEEDIKKFAENENNLVISIKVEDKFGDNGIAGVVIINKDKEIWVVDTFLLSCRVIGRRIEECVLAYILEQARKANVKTLRGEFIHSKKNAPAQDFYKNNGFKLVSDNNEMEIWEYDTLISYSYPDFIKVIGR